MFNIISQFKFVYIWILINTSNSQHYQGDFCTVQRTNSTGVCTILKDCAEAVEDLRIREIYPQTCGFVKRTPIVCCVRNSTVSSSISINRSNKSIEKCREYAEKQKIAETPSLLDEEVLKVNRRCTITEKSGLLMLRGYAALPGEYPHMAAIGFEDNQNQTLWQCSGALISENFILTSAHCLFSQVLGKPKLVRLGVINLGNQDDSSLQQFSIVDTFRHPDYKPPSYYNDIGLLKIDKTVKFTDYARPACLDTGSSVTVKTVPHSDCENHFKNLTSTKKLKNGIENKTHLCVETNFQKGLGTLQLYNREEYCMYTVTGIWSFGSGIEINEHPEVFTKVSSYIRWIEEIVWPSGD